MCFYQTKKINAGIMRSIKKIYKSKDVPFDGLYTRSALMDAGHSPIDPFLILMHHGPDNFPKNNSGLPFGPHPHRGMETVTFILDGDLIHQDSGGHNSKIVSGGIQWMTAGRGIIHSELSSDEFKKNGGNLEILQLWLNLPSKLKMTKPFYKGLQKEEIPVSVLDDGKVSFHAISGNWGEIKGEIDSITDVSLSYLYFKKEGNYSLDIPTDRNVFFYLVNGTVLVNDSEFSGSGLVVFNNDSEKLKVTAKEDSVILLGHAKPINEPVAAYGPFVMNTMQEIQDAYNDYQAGKFNKWD